MGEVSGYWRHILALASLVVKRRLMVDRLVALRLAGLVIPFQSIFVGVPSLETGPGQHAELDLRHPFDKLRTGFNQLSCLGLWWNFQPLGYAPGLCRRECLVQRRHAMGVQVVEHQPGHRDVVISLVNQPANLMGEVLHDVLLCSGYVAPSRLGFASHEQIPRPTHRYS